MKLVKQTWSQRQRQRHSEREGFQAGISRFSSPLGYPSTSIVIKNSAKGNPDHQLTFPQSAHTLA